MHNCFTQYVVYPVYHGQGKTFRSWTAELGCAEGYLSKPCMKDPNELDIGLFEARSADRVDSPLKLTTRTSGMDSIRQRPCDPLRCYSYIIGPLGSGSSLRYTRKTSTRHTSAVSTSTMDPRCATSPRPLLHDIISSHCEHRRYIGVHRAFTLLTKTT